ncbi:MAG: peptidylprolyl isomerase [Patescibacteria group bacterium]
MPSANNNLNLDDQEVNKLRETVLKWIEMKDKNPQEAPKKSAVTKLTKETEGKPIVKKISSQTNSNNLLTKQKEFKPGRSKSKKFGKTLVAAIIIILAVSVSLFTLGLYIFKWDNQVVRIITKIVPYPAAIVNYQPISYYDWITQTKTLKNFYAAQKQNNQQLTVPTPKETQKHILDRLIEQKLLDKLANRYQISVTSTDIQQETQKLATEIGSEKALAKQLKNLYDWDIPEFQKEIIRPLLIKEKLRLALILDERLNQTAIQKAKDILAIAKKGDIPFEQLAQQYSEDVTASQDGDLGYLTKGQLLPEFEQAAFALKPNEISNEIVKTPLGYHVIKVDEVLTDDNGEITQIRARHILIHGQDLTQYLEELKKQSAIWQLVII